VERSKPSVGSPSWHASLIHRHHHHYYRPSTTSRDATPQSVSQSRITPTRMRPPTRSTRSVRPSLNTNNSRRSRNAPGPGPSGSSSHPVASPSPPSSEAPGSNITSQPKHKPKRQSIIIVPTPAAADAKVNPGTSTAIGSSDPVPATNAPVVGCFPVLPPTSTFVYENQSSSECLVSPSVSVAGSSIILGRQPPRPRHRMSSNKLETLDAFFRRNTHPSRKEKEAICKDLDM
jgi:hypothetical protein